MHTRKAARRSDEARLDRMFSALADPTRRRMVEALAAGEMSVSALAKPLKMSLPAVAQHLQVLERSGLVTSAKVGRVRTCRVDAAQLDAALAWMGRQRAVWESRLDRLEVLLEEMDDE
jgi:DNA-binding transcriptional ArsR family regulator